MFGLGKKRTKFGKYLDRKGITQSEVAKKAKVSNDTISRLCNESDYRPKISTVSKIKKALDKLGVSSPPDDYFGMWVLMNGNGTYLFFGFLFAIVIIGIVSSAIIHRIRKNKKNKMFDGEEIVVEKQDELPENK